MRKITEQAVDSFMNGYKFSKDHTKVEVDSNGDVIMYLWGNAIARKTSEGIEVSLAGWNTNTTRERLNGIPGIWLGMKKGAIILNGVEINSMDWYKI